jgi:mercuric ion transport protein
MRSYLGVCYLASVGALGVATCCVLPMAMMLLGLGGSWIAVLGKIAAASYYVLATSTALVLASWAVAYRRSAMSKLKWWLGGTSILTALAWIVVVNETRINDFLIRQM